MYTLTFYAYTLVIFDLSFSTLCRRMSEETRKIFFTILLLNTFKSHFKCLYLKQRSYTFEERILK